MLKMLSSQLKQLSKEQVNRDSSGLRREVPTLIFGRDAKNITMQQVYEISLASFNELCLLQPNLRKFQQNVYSEDSVAYDRDVHSARDNQELDKQILQYLRRVVQYFTYPACIKSLEFLVRRFRIDLYLKQELFTLFMPFHELQSYKLVVDCLNLDFIDQASFPCSRDGLMPILLLKNEYQLQEIITTASQLKAQSFEVYSKFALTILMEMYGKMNSLADLSRKCFEFALLLLEGQLSKDIVSYTIGLLIMLSKEKITIEFYNEILFRISQQEQLSNKHKLLVCETYMANNKYEMKADIAAQYLVYLCECYPDLLSQNKYITLSTFLLKYVIYADNPDLQSSLLVILAFLQKMQTQNLHFPVFLQSLTLELLKCKSSTTQELLSEIEILDNQQYNIGISLFIEEGGNFNDVEQLIKNNSLLMLEQKLDDQSLTIISALQAQDYNIRFQAIELVFLLVERISDEHELLELGKFLINEVEYETDMSIIGKYLNIIIEIQGKSGLSEYLESSDTCDEYQSFLQTFKRMVSVTFTFTMNDLILYMKALFQRVNTSKYHSLLQYILLFDLFVNDFKVENFVAKYESCQGISSIFPFDDENEFLQNAEQNFDDNSLLSAIYLLNLERFELSSFMVEKILKTVKLQAILMNQLHSIQKIEHIKSIICQLRGDLLLNYFIDTYQSQGIKPLVEIIQSTCSAKQLQSYEQFIAYLNGQESAEKYRYYPFFIDLLTTQFSSPNNATLFEVEDANIQLLLSQNLFDICNNIGQLCAFISASGSSIIIRSFLNILFSKVKHSRSKEQSASLILQLYEYLLQDGSSPELRFQAVDFYAECIRNYPFCRDIGLQELSYHSCCIVSDRVLQEEEAANIQSLLTLAITVLNLCESTEFEEIPLLLWILFDIQEFNESIKQTPELMLLVQNENISQLVKNYFASIPLSLKLCENIIEQYPSSMLSVLLDHDGMVENSEDVIAFIMDELKSDDQIVQNQCIKLLIKYQSYPNVEFSSEEALFIYKVVKNHSIVDDPISKLSSFAPFFDLPTFTDYIIYCSSYSEFDETFLEIIMGTIEEKFHYQELINVIIELAKAILNSSVIKTKEKLSLFHVIYEECPEILSVLMLLLSSSEMNIYEYLKEIPQAFDTSVIFGSVSVLLGYLFDVPMILDILLEDNGEYVPKLLLDELLPENDECVDKLIDSMEILISYIDENSDITQVSGSLEVSPFEFLVTILLQINEPLSKLISALSIFINSPMMIVKLLKDIEPSEEENYVYEKAFLLITLVLHRTTDISMVFDLFAELQSIIEQKFNEPYIISMFIEVLEKSMNNEGNTKMVQVCSIFVQQCLQKLPSLDPHLIDLCIYGLTFCPAVMQTRLIPFLDDILRLLRGCTQYEESRPTIVDFIEEAVQYTIKFTSFLLPAYFDILREYPPTRITKRSLLYGEIEMTDEDQSAETEQQLDILEEIQRILQVVQLNLPTRIIYPFVLSYIKQNAGGLRSLALVAEFNFLLVHLLRLTAQSQSSPQQLFTLFSEAMDLLRESEHCNILASAVCSVFPAFVIAFTGQELQLFLSECLNYAFRPVSGGVKLFSEQQGINISDYYALSTTLLLFAAIATLKQAPFYEFVLEHLPDIVSNIYSAGCGKLEALDKTVVAAQEDTGFETPFYIVLTEFANPVEQLSYLFFRFAGEIFHSAPFAFENGLVLKVHRLAIYILQYNNNSGNSHISQASIEFYSKVSKLQAAQLEFDDLAEEIGKDLIDEQYVKQLVAFTKSSSNCSQMAQKISDEIVEIEQSGELKEDIKELIQAIESSTKKGFGEFI